MKKLLYVTVLLTICITIIGVDAYAAPSIASNTGDLTHGEQLTLTGTNFGTKSTATPMYWDTLEDGVCDTSADYGTWGSVKDLTLSTVNTRHDNSSNHGTLNFIDGGDDYGYFQGDSTVATKWYCSYWFYIGNDFEWASSMADHLGNVKMFRMWNPGAISENLVFSLHPSSNRVYSDVEYIATDNLTEESFTDFETAITQGTWHHFEFEFEENSAKDASDAVIRYWFDGDLKLEDTAFISRESDEAGDNYKRPFILGFYNSASGNGDASNLFQIDDVYADNTWARVVFGNASTFSSCTVREVQVPLTWSTTDVGIKVNMGSFDSNDTIYAFVVDSDGNVSEGYEVLAAGASTPTSSFMSGNGSITGNGTFVFSE